MDTAGASPPLEGETIMKSRPGICRLTTLIFLAAFLLVVLVIL